MKLNKVSKRRKNENESAALSDHTSQSTEVLICLFMFCDLFKKIIATTIVIQFRLSCLIHLKVC